MGLATEQRSAVRGIVDLGKHLGEFLGSLPPAEFRGLVPAHDLRVDHIAAALLVSQTTLLTTLNQPTTQRPIPLPDYCASTGLVRHRSADLPRETADDDPGTTPAEQFRQVQHKIDDRLDANGLPDVVAIDGSALRTLDLLRLVGLEWVLHADDLNRAVPGHRPVAIPRQALASAVRLLAAVLRSRHPGHSVEVRIPPFAAVQCGSPAQSGTGEPRHTRGTPPTVIEFEPLPFLRLCRGRETWDEALRLHHVTASGVRADISGWLPVF